MPNCDMITSSQMLMNILYLKSENKHNLNLNLTCLLSYNYIYTRNGFTCVDNYILWQQYLLNQIHNTRSYKESPPGWCPLGLVLQIESKGVLPKDKVSKYSFGIFVSRYRVAGSTYQVRSGPAGSGGVGGAVVIIVPLRAKRVGEFI